MKKSKKQQRIDSLLDIVIIAIDIATIAVLIYTVMIVVPDSLIKFLLVTVGAGALYNNIKYAIQSSKKEKENNIK